MHCLPHLLSLGALTIGLALSTAACGGPPRDAARDAGDGRDAGSSDAGSADAATDEGDGGRDGSLDASDDAWTQDATTDPCSLGCEVDTHDVDDNPLTGTCGCEYVCDFVSESDAFDDAFTDANCDGGDGVVDACVYVSTSQGLDANPGTRAQPMQTISAALAQADANSVPFVCVSGEVYAETYTLPLGVGLVGGFDHLDSDFPFRRETGITTTVNGSTLP